MAEHVGVQVGDAGLAGAAVEQVSQAGDREWTTLADPQGVEVGEAVARPDTQVAVQG
jgi:hypothetical protein